MLAKPIILPIISVHARQRMAERHLDEQDILDRFKHDKLVLIATEPDEFVNRLLFFETRLNEFYIIIYNYKINQIITIMPSIWRERTIPELFKNEARKVAGVDYFDESKKLK